MTGPTEQVSYIGIIDIADVPPVAIRSEKTMDFDGQRVSGGLTVQHSDGLDLTMYIMLNVNEKAGIRLVIKGMGDAFDPSDWDSIAMMAGVMYSKCSEWKIDSELLAVPVGIEFGASMDDLQHAVKAIGEAAENL
ncbi:MAG: hypothetical protein JKX81_11495 [Arenicella sp.]|nr:hypothetical protein [Arenicella sp.]